MKIMKLRIPFLIVGILYSFNLPAQNSKNSWNELRNMVGGFSPIVDSVIQQADKYKLQIILTKITRSANSPVEFKTFDFLPDKYFYPASLVKIPAALLTLEILDSLNIQRTAFLKMNKDIVCGSTAFIDKSLKNNLSFNQIIEDMIVVSDNGYYNLLYHFLSPQLIKSKLSQKHFSNINIFKSFSGCSFSDNLKCNSFIVYQNSQPVYKRGITYLDSIDIMHNYSFSNDKLVGKYMLENRKIINKQKDFNYNLEYPLRDVHESIRRLIFPDLYEKADRWIINNKDREFIIRCMGIYPSEMQNTYYHDTIKFPPNYYKYLIFGDTTYAESSRDIRTIGKIGISYGFVTESAYIVDFKTKSDFFLSISMYVNSNEIANDGKYEYEKIARPFFAQLSRIFLNKIQLEKKTNDNNESLQYFDELQVLFK